MKRTIAGFVAIVCLLGVRFALAAEKGASKAIGPCVVISGADSRVTKRQYFRITSPEQWARIWQEHKGERPTDSYDFFHNPLTLPEIDFDRYMVIAVFQGESVNSAGIKAVSISESDDRILFQFEHKGYQTLSSAEHDGENKATAYGFFVIQRSNKSMAIEEDVQRYIGQPPTWKERTTFPKTDSKK